LTWLAGVKSPPEFIAALGVRVIPWETSGVEGLPGDQAEQAVKNERVMPASMRPNLLRNETMIPPYNGSQRKPEHEVPITIINDCPISQSQMRQLWKPEVPFAVAVTGRLTVTLLTSGSDKESTKESAKREGVIERIRNHLSV
jgi:hypothetical protein